MGFAHNRPAQSGLMTPTGTPVGVSCFSERDVTDKFIGYFRLLEACGLQGCPICRCLSEDGRRHVEALLDEQVNDPDTRRRLRAAWGLCNWHTWMLRTATTGLTGSAILYADLVRIAARRMDRSRSRRRAPLVRFLGWLRRLGGDDPAPARPRVIARYRARSRCPLCSNARGAEARYVDAAIDFSDDPQFVRAYARSSGFCVPHAMQAIERRPGASGVERLMDETIGKWIDLARHLDDFVRKHEYRNTEPISETEAGACAAAFEIVAGGPGLFGNDLHREIQRVAHDELEDEPMRAALGTDGDGGAGTEGAG
jgi:hypothetical protein